MNIIVNVILMIVGCIFLIGAAYFLIHGIASRRHVPTKAYGVQQQEARHGMLIDFLRSGILFIVAFIAIGVVGFRFLVGTDVVEVPVTPENPTDIPIMVTVPSTPTTVPTISTPLVSPTSPIDTPTSSPTDTPTPTDTPVIPSARVVSPNGLWLRETPNGNQELELIPDGTVLVLLAGLARVEEEDWQQVRTPTGNEGWVATEFIEYQ